MSFYLFDIILVCHLNFTMDQERIPILGEFLKVVYGDNHKNRVLWIKVLKLQKLCYCLIEIYPL